VAEHSAETIGAAVAMLVSLVVVAENPRHSFTGKSFLTFKAETSCSGQIASGAQREVSRVHFSLDVA
jgi:hypothetical protein